MSCRGRSPNAASSLKTVHRHQGRPHLPARKRLAILQAAASRQNEALQSSQLAQLRAASSSLNSSLAIARGSLGQLNIRAPVAGQLTGFDIQLGQSLQRGERSARSTAPAATNCSPMSTNSILAGSRSGQTANADADGKTYRMKVTKIYPQVRNGQFQIDLLFDRRRAASIQRGQTIQAKLTLGDPSQAVLIPNGAFFNDTGGNWVFVVDRRRQRRDQARRSSSAAATPTSSRCSSGLKPGERSSPHPTAGSSTRTASPSAPANRKEHDPC